MAETWFDSTGAIWNGRQRRAKTEFPERTTAQAERAMKETGAEKRIVWSEIEAYNNGFAVCLVHWPTGHRCVGNTGVSMMENTVDAYWGLMLRVPNDRKGAPPGDEHVRSILDAAEGLSDDDG